MYYNIKINQGIRARHGYIRGEIDNFSWYALVHKSKVELGINPANLNDVNGRVSRLCIYKDIPMSNYTKRLIYANYKREWDVFNKSYEEMIKNLVQYLERIYSIKAVK